MKDLLPIIGTILVILILIFLIFRELINWYWKINERISISLKTNFLLEKLLLQLGATDLDEITIEKIATGEKIKYKIDKWMEFKRKNPNDNDYRVVKHESVLDK